MAVSRGLTTTDALFEQIIWAPAGPVCLHYNGSPAMAFLVTGCENALSAVMGENGWHNRRFRGNFPNLLIHYHYMSKADQKNYPGKAVLLVKPKIGGVDRDREKIIAEAAGLFLGLEKFVCARQWKIIRGPQIYPIDEYYRLYSKHFAPWPVTSPKEFALAPALLADFPPKIISQSGIHELVEKTLLSNLVCITQQY